MNKSSKEAKKRTKNWKAVRKIKRQTVQIQFTMFGVGQFLPLAQWLESLQKTI